MNAAAAPAGVPDANEQLLIFQTLVGMWPIEDEELPSVRARLKQYLEKAAREAKTHTSWIAPNHAYEEELLAYVDALLDNSAFRQDFVRFQKDVAFYGFLNSLSQVVLKATSPGVPDFYQGSELWDFSLVDPDNRRPVDYDQRASLLRRMKAAPPDIETLLRRWRDRRVKLLTTWKALDLRARRSALFRDGSYEPLDAGPNVCAFVRRHEGDAIVVAVPRLVAQIVKPGTLPLGEAWGDAVLSIDGSWKNSFTGDALSGESPALSAVFARFPVAVLEKA